MPFRLTGNFNLRATANARIKDLQQKAAVLMFDGQIENLGFESNYMHVDNVERNLVTLTSLRPSFQRKYHSFTLRVSGTNEPIGATVAVFDYHPENVTCWSMENAIFNDTVIEYATTTADPIASTTTAPTTQATTTAKTGISFEDELCSIPASTDGFQKRV